MMLALLTATALLLPQDAGDKQGNQGFAGTAAGKAPQVEIPWNRLYDYPEIHGHMDALVARWPDLISMQVIGHSIENREMRVYTINNPKTGLDTTKPAMWIDGNVHGNEVQAAETVVYAAWYLLENYGSNERITALVDGSAFYLLPMVNPDGRAHWFNEAHSAHSSRTGYKPTDNDRDGLFDEDPPNDLDGDGHIVQMRKHVPGLGTHRLNVDDPRIMERVPVNDEGKRGDYIMLGSEGYDDDGDGRTNEDGGGGYDMNRAWPSAWQPGHVQYGAGPYPLFWPETRKVAAFLYAHPNVAAVQSFHNAGGMILNGPGAQGFGSYPSEDLRVYSELGQEGERMLPFYRHMVIWADLYTVFGGFATWTYEGLGIISFTNELWVRSRSNPDSSRSLDRQGFDDRMLMGDGFIDWHEVQHPQYGTIEVGGFQKDVGRVPPSFLIEEMLHRNALFCLYHAESMPLVIIDTPTISDLGDGLRAIDVSFRNLHAIPTRTARARNVKLGLADRFTFAGEGLEVLAGGFGSDRLRPDRLQLAERDPANLLHESGIRARSERLVRWIVRGTGQATIAWQGEKAQDTSIQVEIK